MDISDQNSRNEIRKHIQKNIDEKNKKKKEQILL